MRVVRRMISSVGGCRGPSPSVSESSKSSRGSSCSLARSTSSSPETVVCLQMQVATFSALIAKEAEVNAWQILGNRFRKRTSVCAQNTKALVSINAKSRSLDSLNSDRTSSGIGKNTASFSSLSSALIRSSSYQGMIHTSPYSQSAKEGIATRFREKGAAGRVPHLSFSQSFKTLSIACVGSLEETEAQRPTPPGQSVNTQGVQKVWGTPTLLESVPKLDTRPRCSFLSCKERLENVVRSDKVDAFFAEEFDRLQSAAAKRREDLKSEIDPASKNCSMDSQRSTGFDREVSEPSRCLLFTDAAHLVLHKR